LITFCLNWAWDLILLICAGIIDVCQQVCLTRIFFVESGFELRASHLISLCSTTWATSPAWD
jgi:hypothetical protein